MRGTRIAAPHRHPGAVTSVLSWRPTSGALVSPLPRRRPSGPDVVHTIRRLRIYFRRRLCPRTGFVDFRVDFFGAGFAAFFLAGILAAETATFFLVGFLAGILAAATVAFFALLACGFLVPGRGRETGLACFASAKRMDLIRSATDFR